MPFMKKCCFCCIHLDKGAKILAQITLILAVLAAFGGLTTVNFIVIGVTLIHLGLW